MHCFEAAQSRQTLADGLTEFYSSHPDLKRGESLSPAARAFFRSHDTVHVLYGCGTSMSDEAVVKLASIFGTTAGVAVLEGYALHESIDIYRRLPAGGTLAAVVAAPYLVARTVWRCGRQRAKWPWVQHEQYTGTALCELRASFGIKVAHERTAGRFA